jgi:ABC-type multidrug transport system fused ATPase/permease subunit
MRSTIDKLVSWTGLIVAAVLLVAGGLLMWAASFATSNVHDQLAAQQITMPAEEALTTPEMKANLTQYAGQQMTTGEQAKAYADYYILAHMNESSGGKTYSQVSGEYMQALKADPTSQATQDLGQLRQTLFMGSTLRGMLLNAYAFGVIGMIAFWAGVTAFIGAGLMLVLGIMGLRHGRKTELLEAPEAEKIPATA